VKKFIPIAILLFVFLGSGMFTSCRQKKDVLLSAPPPNGVSFAFEIDHSSDLASVKDALTSRFEEFGLSFFWQPVSDTRVQIVTAPIDHETSEAVKKLLCQPGQLEFRLVHPDSDKLIQSHEIPADYEVLERDYQVTNQVVPIPGNLMPNQKTSVSQRVEEVLAKKTNEPGFDGRIVQQASIDSDPLGNPILDFKFTPEASAAFAKLTGENIGHRIAILIDGEFYSAPIIQTPMESGAALSGSLDRKEALLLSVILSSLLPTRVNLIETKG
jgi:preprotein translocase subunit SecD